MMLMLVMNDVTYNIDKSQQLTEKVSIGPKIVVPEQHPYVKSHQLHIS